MIKIPLSVISLLILFINSYAQWHSVQGPYLSSNYIGMDVKKIDIDDNNILYGIIENNLYISIDDGYSWMHASYGIEEFDPVCFAFNDSLIFAGSHYYGVFSSSNFGSTFTEKNYGLPPQPHIITIFANNDVVLISHHEDNSSNGTYYSTNYGDTWSLTNGLEGKYVWCFASNGEYIYAGCRYNGVYISIDKGKNWSFLGLPGEDIYSVEASGSYVFAGENNSNGKFYKSIDNGNTWEELNAANGLEAHMFNDITMENNYVYIAAYGDDIFRSNDFGDTWQHVPMECFYTKTVTAKGNKVYAGCNKGIAFSNNHGESWFYPKPTYQLEIRSMVISCENIITATDYLLFKSDNSGNTWEQFLYKNNALASFDSIVLSGFETGLQVSKNCGNSFTSVGVEGLPEEPNITSIAMNRHLALAGTSVFGIYISKDDVYNWVECNNGLTSSCINAVCIADSLIFAGTNDQGIFNSADSGLYWTHANIDMSDTSILSIASYRNHIYIGTASNGMYKSENSGKTWQQVEGLPVDSRVRYIYTCGINLMAGITGEGLYLSIDNGTSWEKENTGLLNFNISSIVENGQIIYAGTEGAGIWKRPILELPLAFSFKTIDIVDNNICKGTYTTINVAVVGGKPPYQYLWNNGLQTPSVSVQPLATTTYTINVVDDNSDTIKDSIVIYVKPKPETPMILTNKDTLISNFEKGNIWILNHEYVVCMDTNKYIPTYPGNYTLIINENGCLSDTSNTVNVGTDGKIASKEIFLYPNPSNGDITLEVLHPLKNTELKLYDLSGKLEFEDQITENIIKLDLTDRKNGIYFLKIVNSDFVQSIKILKK